jgi:hypothetical protein
MLTVKTTEKKTNVFKQETWSRFQITLLRVPSLFTSGAMTAVVKKGITSAEI